MLDWTETTPRRHAPSIRRLRESSTGLGAIDRGGGRVSVDDKGMINAAPT